MRRFIAQRQSGTKGPKEPHKTTATTTQTKHTTEKQSKSKTEWHLKLHLVSHAQNNTSIAKWNIIIIIVRCKPADRIALPLLLLLLLVLLQLPLLCYTCRQLGSTSNSCCSFSACFVISINNDLISIVFPAILRANLKDTSMRQSRSQLTSPSPPQPPLLIWQIFSIPRYLGQGDVDSVWPPR